MLHTVGYTSIHPGAPESRPLRQLHRTFTEHRSADGGLHRGLLGAAGGESVRWQSRRRAVMLALWPRAERRRVERCRRSTEADLN